jgi:hypothetical protein
MAEVKLKSGVRFVAEVKEDENGGEVLIQYFLGSDGKVLGDSVTCTCTCGSGSSQTTDSKTCSKAASKSATCNCTGSSAKVSC